MGYEQKAWCGSDPLPLVTHPSARHDEALQYNLSDALVSLKTGIGPASLAYSPSLLHIASTFAFVAESMRSISGQGRVKPSAGHLRVASMPILLP